MEQYIQDPEFLKKQMAESLKGYVESRYKSSLSRYVVAHNAGEDTIIAIDIVISVITIVKGLTQTAQKLPKFNKWIDDVLVRNGKGARAFEEVLLEKKYGKIFRVQGGETPNISKFRFFIKNNKVTIKGDDMVHVTFDDEFRVAQFWTKRGNKAEVFTAEVDIKFIEKIKQEVVSQEYAKAFPDRPQIDDPTKTNGSYGIPKNYFEELIKSLKNPEIIKSE